MFPGVTALEQQPVGVHPSPEPESATGPLAVIDKSTATNRRNALKSTGPRTKSGKLAVSQNSVGHGIYALCPVIEDVESALDWKRYRKAMLDSLAP